MMDLSAVLFMFCTSDNSAGRFQFKFQVSSRFSEMIILLLSGSRFWYCLVFETFCFTLLNSGYKDGDKKYLYFLSLYITAPYITAVFGL